MADIVIKSDWLPRVVQGGGIVSVVNGGPYEAESTNPGLVRQKAYGLLAIAQELEEIQARKKAMESERVLVISAALREAGLEYYDAENAALKLAKSEKFKVEVLNV